MIVFCRQVAPEYRLNDFIAPTQSATLGVACTIQPCVVSWLRKEWGQFRRNV